MKRFLAMLAAVCIVLSFTACGSDSDSAIQPTADLSIPDTQPSQDNVRGDAIYEGSSNVCLFENESCSITLVKAEIDSLSDYCWDVSVSNHSDQAQIFTFKRAYLNDFDFDPLWVERVEAGQTVVSKIIWESPDLQERGILQITRVDFSLNVYQAADNQASADANITVYPSGKGAHIAQSRSRMTTDIDIVDNEDFKFVIVGFDDDMRWGQAIDIYAMNSTTKRVVFTIENVTLEDQPADPAWSYTLDSGKQGLSQIVWLDNILNEVEIEGGLEFEFDLVISDTNGNILERVPCTFVP